MCFPQGSQTYIWPNLITFTYPPFLPKSLMQWNSFGIFQTFFNIDNFPHNSRFSFEMFSPNLYYFMKNWKTFPKKANFYLFCLHFNLFQFFSLTRSKWKYTYDYELCLCFYFLWNCILNILCNRSRHDFLFCFCYWYKHTIGTTICCYSKQITLNICEWLLKHRNDERSIWSILRIILIVHWIFQHKESINSCISFPCFFHAT